MTDEADSPSSSRLVLYQAEDRKTRIEVRLEGGTVWLTQAQVAELFQTTPQNITLHLKAIYDEGELSRRQLVSPTYKFDRKAESELIAYRTIATSEPTPVDRDFDEAVKKLNRLPRLPGAKKASN